MAMTRSGAIPPKADPWQRLAASVAIQAVKDLRDPDPIRALDALGWFLGGGAADYLQALDIATHGDILEKVLSYE